MIRPPREVCHCGMNRKRATKSKNAVPSRPGALAGLVGDVLASPHYRPRNKLVNFLVSEAEHAEMRRTAKKLGLTLSRYLRALHRTALDRMRSARG